MTDTFQELIADSPQTPPAAAPETKTATATAEPVKAASTELADAVKAAQAVVAPEAVNATQLATSDAESALRQLADMGITPTTAPNLIQTAQNAEKLVVLMRQNPAGFVSEIERFEPELARTLLEGVTDEYLRRFPPTDQQTGSQSRGADSYDPRVSQLEAKLAALEAKDTAKAAAEATALIRSEYNKRLDAMLEKLPTTMDAKDRRLIRYEMNEAVGKDGQALQRINSGSFVDMGTHFARAVQLVAADLKADVEKTRQQREAVVSGTIKDVPSAAQAVTGSERTSLDPWDDASLALDTQKVLASLRRG